jgi:hypothetical protein
MRYLDLAAAVASASLAASCGFAPPMTTYDYPKYGFTADFPAPPKVTDTINRQNGSHVIVLDAQSLGRDFAVTVSDVDPTRDIDALADDASEAMAKNVDGEVTYRTTCATAEGALGREHVISKDGRREVRVRFYRSGARLYVLTAKSSMGLSPVAEAADVDPSTESGTDNDAAVRGFLTSFHVTPVAKS